MLLGLPQPAANSPITPIPISRRYRWSADVIRIAIMPPPHHHINKEASLCLNDDYRRRVNSFGIIVSLVFNPRVKINMNKRKSASNDHHGYCQVAGLLRSMNT